MSEHMTNGTLYLQTIFLLFAFLNFSCGPRVKEEEIKKIEDCLPQFKTILAKKENIDKRVRDLENKIALLRLDMRNKIKVLKDDFGVKKREIEEEIREVKKELEPELKLISDKIEELNQKLSSLKKRASDIENMLRDTQSLIEKSQETDIIIKSEADWEREIKLLKEEKEKIKGDIQALKEKILIYELALRMLRQ
ncbi:MAG: hypothetical protein AB7E08_02400 [Candidatus Omnitrophota bacterium]